ncbi:quinoprotein dehydrogenase-associated SoxYZ-like carrier [Rubrimonas sp.]|uniref:quinoprotein dehydrogenase-associated SoxYZ-like carrier n=1 Tax=Rubrimonas sp. TaxID=2036015 RepID=UPI002FDCB005
MRGVLVGLCLAATPHLAAAEPAWPWLRDELFADRAIEAASGAVTLDAPARAADDRAVPISVAAQLPQGAAIRRISLLIDDNPAPVSAVIDLAEPRRAASFAFTMRLNGPSPVRAVVESADGALFMAETLVKSSGLGACAAPPGVDAVAAMATLGDMTLIADAPGRLRLSVSHPSYSGMQMDQITLLYTPARHVRTLEVGADEAPLFTVTGSISLSENPEFGFDTPLGANTLRVRMTDTDGAAFERRFALGEG